jgi:hypothetical protein
MGESAGSLRMARTGLSEVKGRAETGSAAGGSVPARALVARYGWRPSSPALWIAVFYTAMIVGILYGANLASPNAWEWALTAFVVLCLALMVGAGTFVVRVVRRSVALGVGADGIVLGERQIPWSEVAAVHLPDTTRQWSGAWAALFSPRTGPPLIAQVHLRDGTQARRIMRGVRYDAWGMAEAVRTFAPHVAVTVNEQSAAEAARSAATPLTTSPMSDQRRDLDSLLLARHVRHSRLTPGPPTLIPGPELPAIVDLLTHGWTPTPTAPIATLLDLAARGQIHLVAESSGQLMCQLPSQPPSEPLAPFEQQLLWHAAGRLSGDSALAGALLPDSYDEDGERWYRRFKADVINEAMRIGLVRGSGTAAGRAAASRWLGVRAALLTALRPPRLPEAGASLNDRMLAWAVALSAAPDVPGALALAEEDWVWSSAGGRRRRIRITSSANYLAPWAPAKPTYQQSIFTGRVIRRWTVTYQPPSYPPSITYTYHVAVHDGRSEEAFAWRVSRHEYKRLSLDSAVQISIDQNGRLVGIR